MTNNTRMFWLQAITPLHVGAGKGIGFIDMPIMREKVTNWPVVPGSALKGVLRDHFKNNWDVEQEKHFKKAFGTKPSDEDSNAGSLIFTDAHTICFPVRSLYGTFAYITSPLVLNRVKRDMEAAGYKDFPSELTLNSDQILHTKNSKLTKGNKIFFEDLDFHASADVQVDKWATLLSNGLYSPDSPFKQIFLERFALLSDDSFNFLVETGTEVSARIRINQTSKIVEEGALWYEESLPPEAILGGLVWCDRLYGGNTMREGELIDHFCKPGDLNIQIGGKATVGKGRVRCRFTTG